MTIAIDQLPNDIAALKRLLLEERQGRQAAIDQAVREAVAALLRRYYGPRSEKFDPRQLFLFGQRIEELPLDAASVACHGTCHLSQRVCMHLSDPTGRRGGRKYQPHAAGQLARR